MCQTPRFPSSVIRVFFFLFYRCVCVCVCVCAFFFFYKNVLFEVRKLFFFLLPVFVANKRHCTNERSSFSVITVFFFFTMVAFSFPVDANHRFFFPHAIKRKEKKKRALKRRERKKNCFLFFFLGFSLYFLSPLPRCGERFQVSHEITYFFFAFCSSG